MSHGLRGPCFGHGASVPVRCEQGVSGWQGDPSPAALWRRHGVGRFASPRSGRWGGLAGVSGRGVGGIVARMVGCGCCVGLPRPLLASGLAMTGNLPSPTALLASWRRRFASPRWGEGRLAGVRDGLRGLVAHGGLGALRGIATAAPGVGPRNDQCLGWRGGQGWVRALSSSGSRGGWHEAGCFWAGAPVGRRAR